MSIYRYLIKDGYEKTSNFHLEQKIKLEKGGKMILYFAIFGSLLGSVFIYSSFGQEAANTFFIGSWVWYILGFQYCQNQWDIEKNNIEYFKVLEEYMKDNPDKFDEDGFYIYPEER